LKSGIYYPYIAFELIVDELNNSCSTWNTSKKLPLSSMTINERLLYKTLQPNKDFSSSSKLILCSIVDQFLQLIEFLKASSTENHKPKMFARFTIDIQCGSIREIDIMNSEATTKYYYLIIFIEKIFYHDFRYNNLRSTLFPSIQTVTRQLCFEDEKVKPNNLVIF
jgi:hypothetical protein